MQTRKTEKFNASQPVVHNVIPVAALCVPAIGGIEGKEIRSEKKERKKKGKKNQPQHEK
jgi:hypothetical protein